MTDQASTDEPSTEEPAGLTEGSAAAEVIVTSGVRPGDVEVVEQTAPAAPSSDAIHEPGKLLRIAVMLREMQGEVRRAPTDDAGRERLRVIHERAVGQLSEALSGDLRDELSFLTLPFDSDIPSESEILISQAQLIGWLEGLFQGIQAAMVNQQLQVRQQLELMRQRGLPMGPGGGPAGPGQPESGPLPGQYL